MPCNFCNDTGLVLKNTYAGDVQPWDNSPTVEQEDGLYSKMVDCHMCSDGGPSEEPEHILVKQD